MPVLGHHRSSHRGFTMIELLVVLAILSILMIMAWFAIMKYFQESRDSVRKTHLEKYRIALEEYFADYRRYPPEETLQDCGSSDFKPYLSQVYCDPTTNEPYRYVVTSDGSQYQLYTVLDNEEDLDIAERACASGCGPDDDGDGDGDYNYGFSNSQVGVGDSLRKELPALCPGQTCTPNVCGNCCPGSRWRCGPTGKTCYLDTRCGR